MPDFGPNLFGEYERDKEENILDYTVRYALAAYLATVLWAEVDDAGKPLDERYTEASFTKQALKDAKEDVASFVRKNWSLVYQALEWMEQEGPLRSGERSESQLGHDFWLTRNGHGAGFWDGDWGPFGDALTAAAKHYGEAYVYAHRGRLYFS